MRLPQLLILCLTLPCGAVSPARPAPVPGPPEVADSGMVARIIDEAVNRSRVMETLSWLTDVYGPRLTWSPGYTAAAEWAERTLLSWGLTNVHREAWTPLGRGWTLRRYAAHVLLPQPFPLLSYPRAWSPGTPGPVTADVVYLDASTDSALEAYRGKLKGKVVLLGDPPPIRPHFEPLATRETDSTLLALANAEPSPPRGRRDRRRPVNVQRLIMESRRLQLCQEEGAAAVLAPSRGDGGGIFVQGIDIPDNPDSSMTGRPRIYEMNTEHLSPQIVVAAEHYSRLVRIVQKGRNLRLELDLQVDRTAADSGFNVLAEITGSDLKDEVVMVGGHLDSWHGGTGATDNATGVATSMEAVRILQTLQVKPRRTIRLALWGGEEQGLLGSRAFVRRHLARFPPGDSDSRGRSSDTLPSLTPAGEKFSCYFNNDNGTGRIRGVYLQGQDELRPLFRAWLAPFRGMGASTLTSRSTSSTDHISFTAAGLPGFQFIQDDIEYFTRTWHSTMDVYDRAQEQDLKQSAAIMASFLYHAAMRNEPLPRRQVTRWPAPR